MRNPNSELLRRLDALLARHRLSDRKASIKADEHPDAIRMIRRGSAPSAQRLANIARALEVDPNHLLAVAGPPSKAAIGVMIRVSVIGAVQAGLWRDALEWESDDWYDVQVPADPRYPGLRRFALEVRGESMNRLYPDGTIVVAVPFGELARAPQSGERVVVFRRAPGSADFEATLKEYEIDAAGRHILWPRSTDPDHQAPIVLGPGTPPVMDQNGFFPTEVSAGWLSTGAGEPDILFGALVVGSYRPE